MKIVVLCPHFAPDTAPTGTVMTRIVGELVARGYTVHVVTTLPWYRNHRVEPGWEGKAIQVETTDWGTITRLTPFAGSDKRNLVRRLVGFVGFSALAGIAGLRAGGWFRKADAVIAMSPPLTLGPVGKLVAVAHRCPFVFNIQDVFPDAAITTGALRSDSTVGRIAIAAARVLERISYRMSSAVTVLSDDLAANVRSKLPADRADRVHVIPNFADTDTITPGDRLTPYRTELGIGDETVVLYAGNVGFSQSLDLVIDAARRLPGVSFVINGDGSARPTVDVAADALDNVWVRGYQPIDRLSEVLATGDIHVVPLKAGLGDVSVPSKTYSSLAAARPVVAAIDEGTAVPKLLAEADAGRSVPPDDSTAFVAAIDRLAADPAERARLGSNGREWVERHASPAAVGQAYDDLIVGLGRSGRSGGAS